MARRSKGFIELEWTCPNCNTRNKGFDKTCVNCGAPQPENVQFEAPAEKKLVSEEKAAELRGRSADIHCGFCGTRNPSTAEVCSQCGADLKEGVARKTGREIDMSAGKLEPVTCNNCGTVNPGSNINCLQCGAPLPRPAKSAPAMPASIKVADDAAKGAKKKSNWILFGGIGAALVICCVAILILFVLPSQSVQATVSDLYWQTSVPVQEIRAVDYNDERGSPPSDAYNVSCYDDSREICEERVIDRGDGSAEVVEECRTESEQYCDYTVDEWTTIQNYTLDGHNTFPVYAQPNFSSDQRLGEQTIEYTVYFDTEKGEKIYHPDSLEEFENYLIGTTWTIELNALGGVVSVGR